MPSRYYWDSSVFLAWIMDEADVWGPEKMGALAGVVAEIDAGNAVLVTSTLALVEVLAGDVGDEQKARYELLFSRPNIQLIDVTPPVAERAGDLRRFCRQNGIRCPKAEDAVHLATAISLGVDALHALDDDLTALDGRLPQPCPPICAPSVRQLRLDI